MREPEKMRILVVDDEENIRQLLRLTFEGEFEVAEAADGMEGYNAALSLRPDLIVSDIMMPRLDGYGLYRKLRSRPETASIPFVFLSAKREVDERVIGLEMGADDYVVKPFSTKELKAKARSLLRKAKDVRATGSLSGQLPEVDLVEILQLIEMGRKTGLLTLKNGEEGGRVLFRQGEAVYADLGPWRGTDAFFSLLSWRRGDFTFVQQPLEMEGNIQGRGQELLMEGLRLLDEMGETLRRLPPPQTRLLAAPGEKEIPESLAPVVRLFQGGATIQEALAGSGVPPFRFYPLLAEAMVAEFLQVEGAGTGKLLLLRRLRSALEAL